MIFYDKEPPEPTGAEPWAVWARLMLRWAKKHILRSVTGGRLKPDGNSGMHLQIQFPPLPIPQQTKSGQFYPFKIYQPSNLSKFVGQMTVMFTGTAGAGTPCLIVAGPTNLAANPPQVSIADTWRFWSVRCGTVEIRPVYTQLGNFLEDDITGMGTGDYILGSNNWASKYCVVANTDGQQPVTSFYAGTGGFDNTSTAAVLPPVAIGIAQNAEFGAALNLWLEFMPDTASLYPSVKLQGQAYAPTSEEDYQWPAAGQNVIPVGAVIPAPNNIATAYVYQMLFDHVNGRFPGGNGNFTGQSAGALQGTVGNFRGLVVSMGESFDTGATCFPADLSSQLFYPGDEVELIFYGTVDYAGQYAPSWARMRFTGPSPAFIAFADFSALGLDIDSWDQASAPDYTLQGLDLNWTVLDIAPDAGTVYDFIYPPGPPP